jgi:hypothetical protein
MIPFQVLPGYENIVRTHGVWFRVIGYDNRFGKPQVTPDQVVKEIPEQSFFATGPVKLVLVGDKNYRDTYEPRGNDPAVHRVADYAVDLLLSGEKSYTEEGTKHVKNDSF